MCQIVPKLTAGGRTASVMLGAVRVTLQPDRQLYKLFSSKYCILNVFCNSYNQCRDRARCCLPVFSMESVKEQRIYAKLCFKVGKTAAETHKTLPIRKFLAKHINPTNIPTLLYSLNSKFPLNEEAFRKWNTSSLMRRRS